MLTFKERENVLVVLRNFSMLNFLPIRVDVQKWRVQAGCGKKWKDWMSKASFVVFTLHSLYKVLTLLQVFLSIPTAPLYEIILHAVLAVSSVTFSLWWHILYIEYTEDFVSFVGTTLTWDITSGIAFPSSVGMQDTDKVGQRLWERSLQDLIAIYLPRIVIMADFVILACYIYDPSMKLLLYSGLPATYRSRVTFWICMVEEARFIFIFAGTAITAWQMQVIAFNLVNNNVDAIIACNNNGGSEGTAGIKSAYNSLRRLQLYMTLLNVVNRQLIFTWKLLSIGMGIVSGYAAIAHYSENPVFGTMYYLLLIDSGLIYTITYEKAFRIPLLVESAKIRLKLCSTKYRLPVQRKLLKASIQSIPPVGVKVGDFHTMERTSTPVFLNYVLTNVVNMLVAYR